MVNALETLKAILSEKLPDDQVQALMAELAIASGKGSVAIQGDATEAVIVTGNQSIVGDNNRVVINQGTDPEELIRVLYSLLQENKQKQILWRFHHTLRSHSDSVNTIAITSNSRTLISAGDDKTIKVWNLNPPHLLSTLPKQEEEVTCIAITPDNNILISGDKEGTVKIWDLQTGNLVRNLSKSYKSKSRIHTIAISPDGNTFAIGASDKTIRIWSLNSTDLLHAFPNPRSEIRSIVIAHDNQTLISGDDEGTIQIWSLLTGKLLKALPRMHNKSINCLAFSRDGEMFATGSSDKTIKLWKLLKTDISLSETLNQEGGSEEEGDTAINAIAFSPDNETLISGSEGGKVKFGVKFYFGGTIRIWNLKNGKLLQTQSNTHSSPINSIAISPNGQYLVTVGKGEQITVWQKVKDLKVI